MKIFFLFDKLPINLKNNGTSFAKKWHTDCGTLHKTDGRSNAGDVITLAQNISHLLGYFV